MEGIDAWTIGQLAHGTGGPLATLLRKRIEMRITSKLYPIPPDIEEFPLDDFYGTADGESSTSSDSWSEGDSFELDGGSAGEEEEEEED